MARLVKTLLSAFLLLFLVAGVQAQSETILVAPDVFLRGLQLPDQVRYTASFIKPTDDTVLRNVSVEITLPPDAVFTEMLVTRQVQFDVVRVNRQGALTLIWQISRVAADTPLDSFSFTVAQPLTSEVEFYIVWQNEDGVQAVVNFLELPPLTLATQSEGQISVTEESYLPVGETGLQLLAPVQSPPLDLTARLLPADFNPPPEFQGIWWCSLLELTGLPQATTADVIVPLRRPLAPFTTLQLFQQQPDNTWSALDSLALVTADGQFAMYTHPGGIVATGVDAEIQPEIKPVSEIQIRAVDLPAIVAPVEIVAPPVEVIVNPPPAVEPITDGTSNTIIIAENTAVPPTHAAITDGSSNTIIIAENTAAPPTLAPITDGSSNTIIISENTAVPLPTATRNKTDNVTIIGQTATPLLLPTIAPITDGSSNTIIIGESAPTPLPPTATGSKLDGVITIGQTSTPLLLPTIAPITDGSSNTIIISENTLAPVTITPSLPPTLAPITDGSSNTIIISENTLAPVTITPPLPPTLALITDGSSNTVIIGENTLAPVTVTLLPTLAPITDGSSNTIIIGESSPAPLLPTATRNKTDNVTIIGQTLTPTLLPTLAPITDGSSNTIIIGESSPTSLAPTATGSKLDNVIIIGGTLTPTLLPTIEAVTDGSSNTIIIGENTATSTTVVNNPPIATVRPPQILPVTIVLNPVSQQTQAQPIGAGGARVVIFTQPAGGVLQCQIGSVNCAVLRRTPGKGLR